MKRAEKIASMRSLSEATDELLDFIEILNQTIN
jgi:hypothetical protein